MRATRSTSARRPNCRNDRTKVAERHLPRTEDLAAQLDDDRVGLVQPVRFLAVLDDFDDLQGNTLAERLRFVRCPFKLAVELAGGGGDGQFANASSKSHLVSQIAVERPGMSREFGTVQQDTARAPQTPDRSALGVGEAVIGPLPRIIQLLASRQRNPAPGFWIDILRIRGFPFNRVGSFSYGPGNRGVLLAGRRGGNIREGLLRWTSSPASDEVSRIRDPRLPATADRRDSRFGRDRRSFRTRFRRRAGGSETLLSLFVEA